MSYKVESCKEFVGRILLCLIELSVVRSMLGELQGLLLSGEL